MQPYRAASPIIEPPARIESLWLRRFPLVLQLFMLARFPAAAIAVASCRHDLLNYMFAQVRIRIAINRDTGAASVHQHRRFRATKTQTLDLGAVAELYLEDLDDNGQGQGVCARRGKKKTRLFDAINVEARRGMEFLEDGRMRWKAQGNETSAAPE